MYERSAMSVRGSGPGKGSSGIYSRDLEIHVERGRKAWMEDGCVGEDMGDGEWVCGGVEVAGRSDVEKEGGKQ